MDLLISKHNDRGQYTHTNTHTHTLTYTKKTQLAGLSSFVAANVIRGNVALIKLRLREDWTGKAGEQKQQH